MGGFSGTGCTLYTVTLYIVHNIKYRTKNVIQNIQITKRLYMGGSSPIKSATAKYDIQDEELQNILKFFTWVARLRSSRPLLNMIYRMKNYKIYSNSLHGWLVSDQVGHC